MKPEDVFHDVQKAVGERKRVFVSRSEANGKIRWVIEIENEPFGSQVHGRLRDIFDQFNPRSSTGLDDRSHYGDRTRGIDDE
jgi:hypothetical protein